MIGTQYALTGTTTLPFDEAVERVREELKGEGFGVLCEIDVQATLKAKLDVDSERYLILGACNPPLAHRALQTEPDIGVLLPCNVVVFERDGETRVSAVDAEQMLSIVGRDDLAPVAGHEGVAVALDIHRVAVEQDAPELPRGLTHATASGSSGRGSPRRGAGTTRAPGPCRWSSRTRCTSHRGPCTGPRRWRPR